MGLYLYGEDKFSGFLTGMKGRGKIEQGLAYVCA